MLLLSNQQHLEYFCILFPRACQRLISGIQTVTRGPVGRNTISVCGTVMSDEQSEFKQTAFSIQIVHSEYWNVLMYPAIELGLIINSFYYNTGSWQPPKSLSRHQRSRSRSTTSSPTESWNYMFDPVFFNSSGPAFPKSLFKGTSQQNGLWLKRPIQKR